MLHSLVIAELIQVWKKINTHHLYTNNDGKRSYC